jgi:hypothetical protein
MMPSWAVYVHSLGSLWQQPSSPGSETPAVWITTGISDAARMRSRAKLFGQVRLSGRSLRGLAERRGITNCIWMATAPADWAGVRKLQLLRRVPGSTAVDRYLVTVTEDLVGILDEQSWDANVTSVLSFSEWRSQQEVMFLMQNFAWLRGSHGIAVLEASGRHCRWRVESL